MERTSYLREASSSCCRCSLSHLPCGVYAEFAQQMIQDTSLVLFTAICSMIGFSFVHFVVKQSPLLAVFEIVSRGVAMYDLIIRRVCHMIKSLLP